MTATFGSDSFMNPLRYSGQNYQFSAVYIRKRDPLSPQSTSADTKPPENLGYYPLGSWWINVVDRRMWVLRGINNNLADWVLVSSGGGGGGIQSILCPTGGSAIPDGGGVVQFALTDGSMTINRDSVSTNKINFTALPVLNSLVFNLPASGPTVSPSAGVVNLRSSNGTISITRTNANTINFSTVSVSPMTNVRTLYAATAPTNPPTPPVFSVRVVNPDPMNNITIVSDNDSIFVEGDPATNTVYLDAYPVLSFLAIDVPHHDFGSSNIIPLLGVADAYPFQWSFLESGGIRISGVDFNGQIFFDAGPPGAANQFVTNDGTATPTLVGQTATLNVLGVGSLETTGSGNTVSIKEPNCALFIVDPDINYGTHSTIQSAIIDAAIAGGHRTIFIRPGTYTEDLIMAANVNLTAFICDSRSQTVKIKGQMTYGLSGNCGVTGIFLETNGDYLLHQSAGTMTFQNCFFNAYNNTAMLLTGGSIDIFNCQGDILSPATTLFTATTNADIYMESCFWANSVASSTPSTLSNCFFACTYCTFASPIVTSGYAVFGAGYTGWLTGGVGSFACDFGGTGQHTLRYCYMHGGTNPCMILEAANITETHALQLHTSNTNAVTGAGEWRYSDSSFEGGTTGASVATQTPWSAIGPRTLLVGGAQFMSGAGSPNGSVTAPQGSFFLRTDGSSATTRAYINTNGATGWTGVMTVS